MKHRFTIHRRDLPDLWVDFAFTPTGDSLSAVQSAMVYDLDTAVHTMLIVDLDGQTRGLSVPTFEIDHISLGPVT